MLKLRLYLALFEVLFEESGELRQLGVVGQLRHIDVREIELVGDHECFLLMHASLGSDRAYEEVLRRGLTCLICPSTLPPPLRVGLGRGCLLIFRQNLNTNAVRLNGIAIHFDGRRTDGEGTGTLRHEHVRVGLLE